MARYAQLHTDDGLAVIKAGLAKEFVLALTFIAQHEDEAIPVREYQKAVKKLAEIGVEITLQRAIGKTLSDNARSKRYYEKTQDKRKNSHVRNDVKPNVEPHSCAALRIVQDRVPRTVERRDHRSDRHAVVRDRRSHGNQGAAVPSRRLRQRRDVCRRGAPSPPERPKPEPALDYERLRKRH
jgi:hypothetical protein